jgi:hypothetical protein
MEMDCPDFLRTLCAVESIRPWSHYGERSRWRLRKDHFDATFAGKMGLYCYWWTGPRQEFLGRLTRYQYKGELYAKSTSLEFHHAFIPVYVGISANAEKRMRQRLMRFASLVNQWLMKESRLITPPKPGCGQNFELFDFPDRVRAGVAVLAGVRNMSLAQAQQYLAENHAKCRSLIKAVQKEYHSLLFDNYSLSFVSFSDEADLFYAEALSIGLLRPPFNHG